MGLNQDENPESGSSLRAAGFRVVADVPAAVTWARDRTRRGSVAPDVTLWGERTLPGEPRLRWERILRE